MATMRRATPITLLMARLAPFLYTENPNPIASTMKRSDDVAASGTATKVLDTILANAAITRTRVSQANIEKSFLPFSPIFSPITSPSDLPPYLTDANNEPMSWTPPKKMEPITIHRNTGTHPKMAAAIGPTIGPAPAIDEK